MNLPHFRIHKQSLRQRYLNLQQLPNFSNDTRATLIGQRTVEALAEIYHAERLVDRHSIVLANSTEDRIVHGQQLG